MSKRLLILVFGGALLAGLEWWFLQNYGLFKEQVRVGFSGEARVNSYFAARLTLEKLGYRVKQSTTLGQLGQFAPRGALMMAASRRNLDAVTARDLLAWVDRGGHLIVAADAGWGSDVLMDLLGIEADYEAEDRAGGVTVDTVTLPDATALRVDLLPSPRLLDEDEQASWRHEFRDGVRMLALERGEGRVTVMATLAMFGNRDLGRLDHAELLARLTHSASREVWIVRYLDAPSLLEWLWGHAAHALVALGAFIGLWLWRVIVRFGPLLPSPAPDRRSLFEHVRALGRFYADHGELPRALQRLRADIQAAFDRFAPELRGADGNRQLAEAARLTRIRARDLHAAFTGRPQSAKDFTHTVRTLALLRSRLQRRPIQEDTP
jgi:hypothetical protein